MGEAKRRKDRGVTERLIPNAEVIAIVTAEELHFAYMTAAAAASGRTPRQSFASKFEEALGRGDIAPGEAYWTMNDIPENHAAFGIMDAFPDRTPAGDQKRKALLWRVMFAMTEVLDDPRSASYINSSRGQQRISRALIEAVALTPMIMGKKIPLDIIFEAAEKNQFILEELRINRNVI